MRRPVSDATPATPEDPRDKLRASLEPLIELLSARIAEPPAPPAPAPPPVPDDDPEDEFRARFEAEREDEFRARMISEKRDVATKAARFLQEIHSWQRDITAQIQQLRDEPKPEPALPPVVYMTAPLAPRAPRNWRLVVTSRENGLMRTVLATADGEREIEFKITRTPDGYTKSIEAKA